MSFHRVTWTVLAIGLTATLLGAADRPPAEPEAREHGTFTGEVKLVFYVENLREAVSFYREALGFTFHHFYDHVSGGSVEEWTRDGAPFYAEMSYAGRRFGIHTPTSEADERSVGAAKVYFRVKDLDAHRRRAEAAGARPSKVKKRSWMDMFHVVDEDGNRIYFAFTDEKTHGNTWGS